MLKESALRSLGTLLPKGQVFTDRATLVAYEADAGMDKGAPEGVVFPRTVGEVVRIVHWAAEYRVPLIARGAGTGLSGGAVADRGGIIVEFVHMNRMLAVDTQARSALVEPALINLRLDEHVRMDGLYFPPDPSSQRVSTIGGNVAENSGGPHCFKYGVMTNYVSGMWVVLADGSHIRIGGPALDYPEYDLCGLLTGSEGMLGLMTSIYVRLLRNPPGVKTLLAVFDSVEQAGEAVSAVISAGLVPATIEMMDQKIIRIIEPFAHANLPLDAGAVMIIEVDGYPASLNAQMAELMSILEAHGAQDMRIARDEAERYKIWLARKSAAGAIAREVPAYQTVDITVPRSRLAEMLAEVNLICERHSLRAGHVFHAGDGNLHPLVLIPDPDDPALIARVHQAGWEMVKCCVEMGGSLTGEHGVGIEKRQYMSLMHNTAELMAMWDVKQAFDPDCLLNPGKIFPLPASDDSSPFAGYTPDQSSANATINLPDDKILRPETAEQAVQCLQSLVAMKQPVVIANSRMASSHKIATTTSKAVQYLSTKALDGIKTYAPEDLYITVGAGTLLTDVQAFLAREGKQIALASLWPAATIGGLVAANVNAPLRMRYGTVRDNVLCATVVLTDGRVIRTGRPIVKNVAGFDMTKIFIGSYGTLGLLTDISLKITAQARAKRTLLIPVDDLQQGLLCGKQLVKLALNASAIVLCEGYQVAELPQSRYLIAYTVEGIVEDVEAEMLQVREMLRLIGVLQPYEMNGITGTDIWVEQLSTNTQNSILVRVGIPASSLLTYVQEQAAFLRTGPCIVDMGNGFVYARQQFSDVEEAQQWLNLLRKPALASEGYVVAMDFPASWQGKFDRWGYRPESIKVMQRLKARWDAHGLLNADIFVF